MKVFVFILSLLTAPFVNADKTNAATDSVQWLNIIDNGHYAKSWQLADTAFQSELTEKKWVMALQFARAPLGKVISRVLLGAKPSNSLPGIESGQYMLLQFETEFQNKKVAIETLTLRENNGQWRAISYYIK